MRSSLLALLLIAGCVASQPSTPSPPDSPEADRTVTGTVAALDLDPMAYDADGIVTVETNEGAAVRVLVPARRNLCDADLSGFDGLTVGNAVAVRGAVTEGGGVRPCESPDHYLRRR